MLSCQRIISKHVSFKASTNQHHFSSANQSDFFNWDGPIRSKRSFFSAIYIFLLICFLIINDHERTTTNSRVIIINHTLADKSRNRCIHRRATLLVDQSMNHMIWFILYVSWPVNHQRAFFEDISADSGTSVVISCHCAVLETFSIFCFLTRLRSLFVIGW